MGKLGLPSVLGVLFIILKLVGTITWSWAWVLAPFWIAAILYVVIVAGLFCLAYKLDGA